ncbi:MLX-interacting protein isoform X2 [Ostrinia nubilalis]|uniref:MLX-interacting protein isoform X2 n=1 Tax=Ostrinia nubilalis TaxID=29057 RepID=UPI0030826AF1
MTHVEKRQARPGKETIHSGHFMVSHFEAEAQDEFDDLAVPVPDEEQNIQKVSVVTTYTVPGTKEQFTPSDKIVTKQHQQLSIEISLTKLFKCMTLAYRQKLTSPKWNRFKGIKLRWKDKIRLNNVIWRCWHMQFIKKQNTLVCQFASPLDVDTHVKPETTILEGKYWKRRAEAVIAEYKKWRMFHIMRLLGKGDTAVQDTISDMDTVESFSQCSDLAGNMLTDEDYLSFMSDTLFSTITNHQPFAFPDCREIARGASLADFIQPSLGPLQPNLDDFMDTLEPLQELLSSTPRLPPVPEESALPAEEALYRGGGMSVDSYQQGYLGSSPAAMPTSQMTIHGTSNNTQMLMSEESIKNEQQMRAYEGSRMFAQGEMQGMMGAELMPQYGYEPAPAPDAPLQPYAGKARLQHVAAPKIVTQPDSYYKYTAAVPPSQTAPETVTLLQQPLPSSKYASTLVLQGRGYPRSSDKRRPHYAPAPPAPPPAPPYQPYPQQMSSQPSYEARPRPAAPMQYLPAPEAYKPKPAAPNQRSFKMPSPPLVAATSQQVSGAGSSGQAGSSSGSPGRKEQFRSHSLPLGAQLNADWSLSAPAHAHAPPHAHDTHSRHTARARESTPSALRMRSRSQSGGGEAGARPPLNSVASEPSLPQASVMLAQLLSAQHSKSVYKMGSNEEVAGGSDPKSPIRKGQPSPIGSDIMSPHPSLSPPTSPGSPRAGSPREPRRTHLHAEQKRRYNIKNGFDTLQALIPHLNANPAAKVAIMTGLMLYYKPRRTHLHAEQKRRYNIKNGFDTLQALIPHLNANPAAKVAIMTGLMLYYKPRRTHLHAEQKRRYNIKNGFDTLQALIPHLNANPAAKVAIMTGLMLYYKPRRTHLHAEQKRRYNIKNGFDTLQALIPHLNANPAAKVAIMTGLMLYYKPRRTHLHAEQKRRYNIKNGFDTLQALIPHLNANPAAKVAIMTGLMLYYKPRRTHLHAEQKRRYNIKNGFDTLQALIPHLNANPAAKVAIMTGLMLYYKPRRTHLHAEQKRRYNIKNGFDTLQALIPHLNANPAAKISKAAMLQKGAEYIKQLKAERNQIKEEMESLRQQTESLNNSISNCHSLLPATGAPVSRARFALFLD